MGIRLYCDIVWQVQHVTESSTKITLSSFNYLAVVSPICIFIVSMMTINSHLFQLLKVTNITLPAMDCVWLPCTLFCKETVDAL